MCPPTIPQPAAKTLSAIRLPGLNLDSLGNYFAALGLLCLAGRKWPTVRGCWKDESFVLVGGPSALGELEALLDGIAVNREWSSYEKVWEASQKADTKAQSARTTSLWRSREADEAELSMSQAHIATGQKLNFNPVFGNGGSIGNRDFAEGWNRAAAFVQKPPRGTSRADLNSDLRAFLTAQPCHCLSDFNAACWFSAANKTYNSGTARPFRKGQLTPWAMLFACEAFPLCRGSASRRFGAGRRAAGAFPFIVAAPAPASDGEVGRNTGEAWLPVWERPMAMPEVEAVFSRGRAEVNGKGALTAAAFAAAIIQRGVDAGLAEFRRFSLLRTTSDKTFESRLASVVSLRSPKNPASAAASNVIIALRDALPADYKKGQRWIYVGLRGPIDAALTDYAASESPTNALAVVDAMVASLQKADRNRKHRAENIWFRPLPGAWLAELFKDGASPEARIGLAIASLKSVGTVESVLPYWLGVTRTRAGSSMPENCPFRRVWATTTLQKNLSSVVHRRFVDMKEADARPPFSGSLSAPLADIAAWIAGELDDREVERWIQRFSLFAFDADANAKGRSILREAKEHIPASAEIALLALLKPLFEVELFEELKRKVGERKIPAVANTVPIAASISRARFAGVVKTGVEPPRCARVSRISALLSRGDLAGALKLARETWHALGVQLIDFPKDYAVPTGDDLCQRLLGAMLIPVWPADILPTFVRWRAPIKNKENNQ